MMSLFEKIKAIYPELSDANFGFPNNIIVIQNDSDGRGDYIAKWEHPDYPQPTDEELK